MKNSIKPSTSSNLCIATCLILMIHSFGYAQSDPMETWEYIEPSSQFHFHVERFEANPIIHREMRGMIGQVGENINGPSLISVPDWIENPLGKYYLYFAHHHGSFIRLAYADRLEGPWKIYEGGVLPMEETPAYDGADRDHVASPDEIGRAHV